ncbi:hypothetical protein J4217_03425 [Candidatus Pacearchaeota archaeon]|nr:hypothetical protein [Candidatus Pacearchaeota archaeon]
MATLILDEVVSTNTLSCRGVPKDTDPCAIELPLTAANAVQIVINTHKSGMREVGCPYLAGALCQVEGGECRYISCRNARYLPEIKAS